MIDLIHKFFFFLGTAGGELLKNSVELLIFTILAYMVISEYSRIKGTELKLFSIAFLGLMAHRAMVVFLYFFVVFGGYSTLSLEKYMPIIMHAPELFALVFLVNAFIYPLIKKRFKRNLLVETGLVILIVIIIEIFWLNMWRADRALLFRNHWFNTIFILLQILILAYPIYYIPLKASRRVIRYRKNIVLGFTVYLIKPFLHLTNIVLYDNQSVRLALVEHPFTILAVLLFVRVIYLKLADKARLLDKLRSTEYKYKKEKEISEMKDEFISVVSHELRTPLTSIKLYLSLLRDGNFGKVSKKQKDAITTIDDEAGRLNGMINNILDLSRLEAKRVKLSIKKVDLNELISDFYFKEAEQKGLKVVIKVPGKFMVNVDPEQFKQVLINLINNATKFTEKGKIIISAKKVKQGWTLIIEDTGVGIEKDKIPLLFDKFYQTEHHMTRTQKGSGLGLAIAKKIVELHNGRIEVESDYGKGSRFIIDMPE